MSLGVVIVRNFILCFVLVLAAVGAVEAMTVEDLDLLLKASTPEIVEYQELRQSPWLEKEQHAYGTMQVYPDFLEKRVEYPEKEIWRLYSDRIARVPLSNHKQEDIVFLDSAQITVFTKALRQIVAGQISELGADFKLDLVAEASDWTLALKPLSHDVRKYLEVIEVLGKGGVLQEFIVLEPGGERTVTQFIERVN